MSRSRAKKKTKANNDHKMIMTMMRKIYLYLSNKKIGTLTDNPSSKRVLSSNASFQGLGTQGQRQGLTSLLTSKLFCFSFVIHFTPIVCCTSSAVSSRSLPLFTLLLYDYSLTSGIENVFSNAHSRDDYLYQVSLKSLH